MDKENIGRKLVSVGPWLARMVEFGLVAVFFFCAGYVIKDWNGVHADLIRRVDIIEEANLGTAKELREISQELRGTQWRITEHEATFHGVSQRLAEDKDQ